MQNSDQENVSYKDRGVLSYHQNQWASVTQY